MTDLFDIQAQASRLRHREANTDPSAPTLPPLRTIQAAEASLPRPSSPSYLAGHAPEETVRHIVEDIVPALNGQAASSRYYGFVTGGTLPVAEWADNVVSRADQNLHTHLPAQHVATTLEDAALDMVARLLRLGDGAWPGRTFTTGATASNILGLACARESVVARRLAAQDAPSVGELGLLAACARAGVAEVQVLTSAAHSSLSKAASVVGLGRRAVRELPRSEAEPWRLDVDALEAELQRPGVATVIAVSGGEVNTSRFSLADVEEWTRVRRLADRYGAWMHVDGAFGIFARALEDKEEYRLLHRRAEGLVLADSITVDGHKLLNVPYDCGMFFTRSATILPSVFTNPNAAYLSTGAPSPIPSPLNVGLENSRRFRALPAYAVLHRHGRPGLARLLSNMVELARGVARYVGGSEHYELLPEEEVGASAAAEEDVFIIVLFSAKSDALNEVLVEKINATRQMYVSGTSWQGRKAVRVAVSNWMVDVARDLAVVKAVLTAVAEGREFDIENY
ncbi:hypothetical protein S40288_08828 [Stachybotrys chartarum IBT 40288]|nr:hypothetical protein S40288_08828 [Stachybotrys chartarum IBT 40288]